MQTDKRGSFQKGLAKLPLVAVLIVPVVGQWLIVVGLISYFSIRNGQQEVNSVANQLQSEISALIIDEIDEYLDIPHQINALNEIEINHDIEKGQSVNLKDLQHYFWHQIHIFDTVTSIYFGTTDGGLLGAGREGASEEYYLTQTKGYIKGDFEKYSVDEEGQPLELLTSFPDFDSRTRPWYIGALETSGPTWSDIYILSTGQDLAIAASKPVYDDQERLMGVVSVDLFLSHIDNLLEQIQIGKTGQSYLIERDGSLLATSKGGMMYSLDNEIKRVKAQNSEEPVIQASAQALLDEFGEYELVTESEQSRFNIDNNGYIYQVLPIQDDYGIDWLIVVISPESDFLTHYINNTRSTLIVIVFTLMITIMLNIITARWIVRPIYDLVSASQSLAEGDWEQSVPTNENWIREIFTLTSSFNRMTVQLRKLVQELKLEIIERTTAQEALRTSEAELKKAQAVAHVGNWSWDAISGIMTMSDEMHHILGMPLNETGVDMQELIETTVHPEDQQTVLTAARTLFSGEIPSPIEFRVIQPSGRTRIVMADTGEFRTNEAGETTAVTGIVIDITERKLAEERLLYLATHDPLSGLPNRELFNDRLRHAITRAKRYDQKLSLMFLDLDNFKAVNDAFGHKQGDWLLQLIAQRLLKCVRESDTVARIGGDEFIILLEDIANLEDTLPIAEKITQSVAEPFTLENSEVFITSSIGITIYPDDGLDPEVLLSNADRAMYKSKQEGKNKFSLYSSAMRTEVLERLKLRSHLRQAIQNNELVLYYQPKVDVCNDKIVAVEALLRWNHPEYGMLGPDKFIAIAEESGLIVPITQWVLQTACTQLKEWLDEGIPPVRMAINFSSRDLNRDDIVENVRHILETTGVPPELLAIELTENIIFQQIERAQSVLEELKSIGVILAIDDFGSGYSTLSQLAHFAFDTIKIDRHFAEHILDSDNDRAIVGGIITIANNLGLDVIVEGVETRQQLDYYMEIGCMRFQGWLFSKPLPADEVFPLLQAGSVPYNGD